MLVSLANIRRVKADDCEGILNEFSNFLVDDVTPNKSHFLQFRPEQELEDRVDEFLRPMMKKYVNLWRTVSFLLLLSHGQATVERGFSVNRQVEVYNLTERTFQSLRIIVDHVQSVGDIRKVSLTKDLVHSCSQSSKRYQEYLQQQKNKMKTDESKTKRKRLMELVETMEEKRRCLVDEIHDLVSCMRVATLR